MRTLNRKTQQNNADKNSSMRQGDLLQHNFNPAKKPSQQGNPFRFDLSEIDGKSIKEPAQSAKCLDEKLTKKVIQTRKCSTKRKDGKKKDENGVRECATKDGEATLNKQRHDSKGSSLNQPSLLSQMSSVATGDVLTQASSQMTSQVSNSGAKSPIKELPMIVEENYSQSSAVNLAQKPNSRKSVTKKRNYNQFAQFNKIDQITSKKLPQTRIQAKKKKVEKELDKQNQSKDQQTKLTVVIKKVPSPTKKPSVEKKSDHSKLENRSTEKDGSSSKQTPIRQKQIAAKENSPNSLTKIASVTIQQKTPKVQSSPLTKETSSLVRSILLRSKKKVQVPIEKEDKEDEQRSNLSLSKVVEPSKSKNILPPPPQIPAATTQLSSSTMQLLKIIKEKKKNETSAQKPAALNNSSQTSKEQILQSLGLQAPPARDSLTIPLSYRTLQQMSSFLDQAMNFMVSRKQQTSYGSVYIPLTSLKVPFLNLSGGKRFDLSLFRRIIYVVPELYDYRWVKAKDQASSTTRGWELEICKKSLNEIQQHADSTMRAHIGTEESRVRQSRVKEALEKMACNIYRQKLAQFERNNCTKADAIFWEPEKYKQWHPCYDPFDADAHEIPLAQLRSFPAHQMSHRSQSIEQFLKDNQQDTSIAAKALLLGKETMNAPHVEDKPVPEEPAKVSQNLLDLSAKTGISVETLKLVQQKRLAQEQQQQKQEVKKQASASQKQIDLMCQIHSILSQQYMMNSKQVMPFQDVCQLVQRTLHSQQKFINREEITGKIRIMARLCPELFQFRLGNKHLRLERNITPSAVRKMLEERYNESDTGIANK